jgi:hypothetical protein
MHSFGGSKLVGLRREKIERWQADRLAEVCGSTVNKVVMRLKHLLNRAVAWGYLTTEEREKLLNGADMAVKAADGRARAKRSGSTFSRRSKLTPAAASY